MSRIRRLWAWALPVVSACGLLALTPQEARGATFLPDEKELAALSDEEKEAHRLAVEEVLSTTRQGAEYVQIGDMRFRTATLTQKSAFTGTRWTDGLVYYAFHSAVTAANRQKWLDAAAEWSASAGVTFIARTSEPHYILVLNDTGNWSYVGRVGGMQEMGIYNWDHKYVIAHEIGHALGLEHEHCRSDRDLYIQVLWQNIASGTEDNFSKAGTVNYGPYDFDSVMHYWRRSFSANGGNTLEPLPPYIAWLNTMGHLDHLSTLDREGMQLRYPSTYVIAVSASPALGGTAAGSGTYSRGTVRTVTATPNAGYLFARWTEGGAEVSRSAEYTFTVDRHRTLVAQFVAATLANALDATAHTWTTDTAAPWFAQAAVSHDGLDAAQSGSIRNNEASRMQTTVRGPGRGRFWWKVSSEHGADFLYFTVGTQELARISGEVDWELITYDLPPGSHTLTWTYEKDSGRKAGADAGWVDEVKPGDRPTPGDFDGDGLTDIGCYFAPQGLWFVYKSTEGFAQSQFGYAGTLPVPGDFDGDGRADLGCYFPPLGMWYVFRSREGFHQAQFGYDGTLPITGDFDGDGRTDFGCYHPPSGSWYVFRSTDGFWQAQFGYAGTLPVVGDFDGDGKSDIGCYDPPRGMWYIFRSRDGFLQAQFGYAGTTPVVGDFDEDGRDDFGCHDAATGDWYFFRSRDGFAHARRHTGGIPFVGNFSLAHRQHETGLYYPQTGNWFIYHRDGTITTRQFGFAGTVPVIK